MFLVHAHKMANNSDIQQSLIQYIKMQKFGSIAVILLTILIVPSLCDLELQLQSTQATLYTNNKVLLKFKVIGATVPYSIKYDNIPNTWTVVDNDLVISNFKQDVPQDWTLDMQVVDRAGQKLLQTLRINLDKLQLKLFPISLPQKENATKSKDSQPPTTQNIFNLTDLINRYPGLKNDTFSFGFNPVASSIVTPIIIANSQAVYNSSRDSRQISLYEIKRNAAFLRQTNANKAIANLVFIIQNLNKNIAQARNNLNIQMNRFQYFKDVAFNCSQDSFKLENTIAKINNAIDDRKTKVIQEKTQIDSVTKALDQVKSNTTVLMNQKFDIEKTITPEGLSLISSQKKITECQNNIKNLTTQIESIQSTIRSNNLEINIIKDNTADSNKKLTNINSSLSIVRQKISQLKKQLAEAQDQEFSLMKDQSSYMSIPIQSQIKISNLQRRNTDLSAQVQNLTGKNLLMRNICDQNKADVQVKKDLISQREIKYSLILNRIEDFRNRTAALQGEIKQRGINVDNLNVQISALTKQLQKSSLLLYQQAYICQLSQQKKTSQQQKLEQLNSSITQNTKALGQSNKYLEQARAEKVLADQAVEEIIQQSTNVTLFSIVPNGGSGILAGNPAGNNPSGSALGASFRVDSVERGGFDIKNLSNFLSTVYEMNIDPTQLLKAMSDYQKSNQTDPTTLATVYRMDQSSRTKISPESTPNSNLSSFKCESSSILQNRSGIIEQVTLGSIIVRDNFNQRYTLSISSCTKIASTKSGNFFTTGNKIYFTGVQLFNIFSNTIFDTYSVLIVPV